MNAGATIDESVDREIADFIRQVNYGKVVITIHDSKVVQIEKREKRRFRVTKQPHRQGVGS